MSVVNPYAPTCEAGREVCPVPWPLCSTHACPLGLPYDGWHHITLTDERYRTGKVDPYGGKSSPWHKSSPCDGESCAGHDVEQALAEFEKFKLLHAGA